MGNLQQDRADVEAAQKEAREAQAWLRWISDPANHVVIPCEANRLAALSYFNGEELTVEGLTSAFEAPAFRAMLALRRPEVDRAANLETIKRITGTGETPLTKWQTDEQLAKRAAELEERRKISKLPIEQIRKLANGRPQSVEEDIPAEFTRQRLLDLKGPEFRRIVERFGSKAVTERLNQR